MIVRTGPALSTDLQRLGLQAGDTVLVHASLRSVGPVDRGATTVVQAFLDVLGSSGTLVVPAHTSNNREPVVVDDPAKNAAGREAARGAVPAFDPSVSPSVGMGAIAEEVRRWPGARRSSHPQTSFAAVGALSERLLSGHLLDSPLGEDSPLARLEEVDAKVLLLGVGMSRNTCFHLAEYRQPDPPRRTNGCAIITGSGRQWVQYPGIFLNDADFGQIGDAFQAETSEVRPGHVGHADVQFFPVRAAVRFADGWMRAHRGARQQPPVLVA